MSTPVVKIENLVKRYKELVALDHFNLEIEEGEISVCSVQTVPARLRPSTAFFPCFPMTKETLKYLGKR